MVNYNPEDIVVTDVSVGRDLLLIITGGVAHIGAVSTAFTSPNGVIEVQTSEVPGHKEHTLSGELALRAAKVLERTVTVAMGIHYDHISKEDIKAIVTIVDDRIDGFLQEASKR